MASREISSRIRPLVVFEITDLTANLTFPGQISIDTSGFESAEFLFFAADNLTDGLYTFEARHGDDAAFGTHVPVPVAELIDIPPPIAILNQLFKVGYVGKKRFLSVDVIASGVTVGGGIGAFVILNTPRHAPTEGNT